jgi:hypothetical protein
MASYLNKEISEWNTTDLCNWLLANKFRGISELCQKYSLSGYDLFFINDDILKNELGLKSFHERNVALKLFTKLTYEHLRLNVINSNGDNVILTLDNNQETQLGELADYIGNMFNINPKDILFKDNTKQEVLSPSVKIVKLLILYPKIYKVINVSNMKDYHQADEEMMESGDFQENNNNNMKMTKNYKKGQGMYTGSMGSDMAGSGDMDFQELGNNKKYNNNNYNIQNNNGNNNNYRKNKMRENEQRGNMRQENDEFMNNKYYNMENVKKNIKRQQKDNNENYYYDEEQGNENENDMNRMNNKANVEYNEEYQNNTRGKGQKGKQYNMEQNERPRQNYQYQGLNDKNINYNEESNFGLMSSGNDDEMKFKPSYQLKNQEYNDGKQNYENN